MSDRLITAGGALLACLIVYAMFFQKTPQAGVSRPVSIENGRNGYSAVKTWLDSSGVRTVSLQQRFDRLLDEYTSSEGTSESPGSIDIGIRSGTGNILITTLPHLIPMRSSEHGNLRAWVRSGNTLMVLAALDDTPEWSEHSATSSFLADVSSLSGMRWTSQRSGAQAAEPPEFRVPAETPIELESAGEHPLMEGVALLRGYSDERSVLWRGTPLASSGDVILRLGTERDTGVDAIWQRTLGNGDVIVVASGTLLANHVVAESDSGRFLANVVRHYLGGDGAVIFDDMHQGLSALYDPAAFYRDPRLHYTVLFLVAGWLAYLLGSSNRLAPPAELRNAPRQGDFLSAAAGFMERRLDPRETGLAMLDDWFGEVRRSRGLPDDGTPPWDALRDTPTLPRDVAERIRQSYETLNEGRPVGLIRLHNTLRQAREAIG